MNEIVLSQDLNVITAEIKSYKQIAGQSIFEIGKRLKHVKESDLVHGEFGKWLEEVEINQSTANKMMLVYSEFANSESIPNIGFAKLFHVASLPESIDRKEFIEQEHEIPSTGEMKAVDEMTVRELREVKSKLKQSEERAKRLQKALEEELNKPAHSPQVIKETPPEVLEQIEQIRNQLKEKDKVLQELRQKESTGELTRKKNELEKEVGELMGKLREAKEGANVNVQRATVVNDIAMAVVELEKRAEKVRQAVNRNIPLQPIDKRAIKEKADFLHQMATSLYSMIGEFSIEGYEEAEYREVEINI